MSAVIKGMLNLRVALPARVRDVEFRDRGLVIIWGEYLVRAMAIGTDGGLGRSLLCGSPVHALLVRDERLGAHAVRFHQKFLPVTAPARRRNVGVIHRRLSVACGNNLMHPTVTIFAIRRPSFAALASLRVRAVRVCVLRIRVTLHTRDLLRRSLMNQALYIRVTIHAGEHRGMNGMLKLGLIDIQADLLAALVLGQSRVGVASEAVFVFELVLGACGTSPNDQR